MAKSVSAIFIILLLVSTTVTFATPTEVSAEHIPSWVKDVAGFWASGGISESEFINAIKFLMEEGILQLEEKQTQQTDDGDWLSGIHNSLTNAVKQIQANPTADLIVKSVLPEIPIAGPLLANLYENASGSTSEKNEQIIKILQEYQGMNEEQLKKSFAQLEENKELIIKNQYSLNQVLIDTKVLMKGQENILNELKEQRKLLNSILAANGIGDKVDRSKIGMISQDVQKQLDDKEKEINQLKTQIEELTGEKIVVNTDELEKLANSKLYAGKYDEAIQEYMKILEIDENNFDALTGIGWAYAEREKHGEAIEWFEKALLVVPDDAMTMVGLGWAYSGIQNPTEALRLFNKAIELEPENADAYVGKGWALYDLERYDEAIDACQTALDIDPTYPGVDVCIDLSQENY